MARLFLVSYAPLSLMFAARLAPHWVALAFSLLAGWGTMEAWVLGRRARSGSSFDAHITKIEDQSSAVAGYLATYLLPFLGTLPERSGDWIAFVIYFCVAFLVFARSDLALINPTLYLFGWRVQRAETNSRSFILLSRRWVDDGDHLRVRRIMGDVLIEARIVAP
jgi:hypothetical protein